MQFIIRCQFSTASSCFYKTLGVQLKASQDEIKRAYILLAKEHHPDVNKNSGAKFKDISNAYSILKDPIKRNIYDQTQEANNANQQSSQSSSQSSYQNQDNYQQKAYQRQYQSQANKSDLPLLYWSLMGGMIVYCVYLAFTQKRKIEFSPKDQFNKNLEDQIRMLTIKLQTAGPFTFEQLNDINNLITKMKNQQFQTSSASQNQLNLENVRISDIRRKNIFMSTENIDSSPHVMAKRKKVLEEEMKTKQFKIEYETWHTVRSGDVSRLQRKTQSQTRKKSRKDDVILEDFAKQHRISLIKKEREAHSPIALSLTELEESYI